MLYQASFSHNIPELSHKLNITLNLSTYQEVGKVILLSSGGTNIVQLLRDFDRPMGIAIHDEMLALALQLNVAILCNDSILSNSYPHIALVAPLEQQLPLRLEIQLPLSGTILQMVIIIMMM
jgi:hypothetical protein